MNQFYHGIENALPDMKMETVGNIICVRLFTTISTTKLVICYLLSWQNMLHCNDYRDDASKSSKIVTTVLKSCCLLTRMIVDLKRHVLLLPDLIKQQLPTVKNVTLIDTKQ